MILKNTGLLLTTLLFAVSGLCRAQELPETAVYQQLANEWALITYTAPAGNRELKLKQLYMDAKENLSSDAANPELLTWVGIIAASYAGEKGGMGALKLAKQARQYLTDAMSVNKDALDGGARTSLGALYYQVPPWPIGFGNSKKAGQLLRESYEKYPENVDVVFFYADYLLHKKQMDRARVLFEQAAELPIRDYRRVADTGRQQKILEKLALLSAQ